MLPDKMEHCIVFMNSWDVSGVFWSFSKCNITIPHFPTGDSILRTRFRARKEGGMAVRAPSAPVFAPPEVMARTIALHSAVESALLLCTMEPFCSPG